MKHLVFFAWAFPPHVSGGVFRHLPLVRYGKQQGLEISVIASSLSQKPTQAGQDLLDTVPKDTPIARITKGSFKKKEKFPLFSVMFLSFLSNPQLLLLLIRTLLCKPPRIDGNVSELLKIKDYCYSNFKSNPPDIVMASGPPFHTFIAACFVAAHYKAKLVLDYCDEWTECPFDFVETGKMDLLWEQECLKRADRVIFVNQSVRDKYLKIFPMLDSHKCYIAPNGWEPEDFQLNSNERDSKILNDSSLILSFVGTLSYALPAQFLATLERVLQDKPELIEKLKLRFIGNKSPQALTELSSFAYPEIIENIPLLPKQQANQSMQESTGLLLLNPPELACYLPGKLYDYLATSSPIIVYGEGGDSANLVKELEAGFIVPEGDHNRLAQVLEKLLNNHNKPHDFEAMQKKNLWLKNHTREALVSKTVEILNSM